MWFSPIQCSTYLDRLTVTCLKAYCAGISGRHCILLHLLPRREGPLLFLVLIARPYIASDGASIMCGKTTYSAIRIGEVEIQQRLNEPQCRLFKASKPYVLPPALFRNRTFSVALPYDNDYHLQIITKVTPGRHRG